MYLMPTGFCFFHLTLLSKIRISNVCNIFGVVIHPSVNLRTSDILTAYCHDVKPSADVTDVI